METVDYKQTENLIITYNEANDETIKKKLLTLITITCSPLVKSIAYGLARRSSDPIEDIIQVANIGLIKAVMKYKPSYKNLKTWLSYSIVGEIKHYLRDKVNLVKPPREIIELAYRINKMSPEILEEEGLIYNEALLAQKMNVSKEKIREVFETDRRKIISLDDIKYSDNEDKAYIDDLKDEEIEYKNEYKFILNDAINKLSDREQKVILGIYFEGKLQSELAKELHTFQSNVSRIQKRALNKLFNIIKEKEG